MTDEFGASGMFEDGVFKPYGDVVKSELADPLADLSPAVQKSLADAGISTVEQAKALGQTGLEKLPDIGPKTASDILAL